MSNAIATILAAAANANAAELRNEAAFASCPAEAAYLAREADGFSDLAEALSAEVV